MMSSVRKPGGRANIVAILASSSGSGCTSTVANLAWVLAGAGRRVLVLDWGSEYPRIAEYLKPLPAEDAPLLVAIARSLVAVDPLGDLEGLAVRVFAWPGATGHIDIVTLSGPQTILDYDPGVLDDLRTELPRAGYDHVLIDAPTVSADTVGALAGLCDLAVVCFRQRPMAVDDAAELATRLRRQAPLAIDLVPVVTAFDDRYPPRAERARASIRAAFAGLLHRQGIQLPGGLVAIPYRRYDLVDPLLAVLLEEPSPDDPVRAGYGLLAAAVTDGAVAAPPPVEPAFRSRYRRAFGLESPGAPDRVLVAYAVPDRPWADWIRARLDRAGATTGTLADGESWLSAENPPGVVVVSSAHLAESPQLAALTDLLARAKEIGKPLTPLYVLVDGTDVLPAEAGASVVASPDSERQLVSRLLQHFGLIEPADAALSRHSRRPGDPPEAFSLPPRHPGFVGRGPDLEDLRDLLTRSPGDGTVVTVSGVPGIGKSELVLEYAYRFAGDYDLVWWLPAEDTQSVLVGLSRLAARLHEPGRHGFQSFGTTAALDRLATDPSYRRFLLVYDNVGDPSDIGALLPRPHNGHVLITSTHSGLAGIELGVLTPQDSTQLLTAKVPGLSRDDAERVATAVNHLPIALELTGAWLEETAAAERRAARSVVDAAAWAARAFLEHVTDSSAMRERSWQYTIFRVVTVITEAMRHTTATARIAVLLAEMCAFLSPDGVALDLVHSSGMIRGLIRQGGSDAWLLSLDATEIDRVLWLGARYGLFRVDWGAVRSLRMHRVVQAALHEGMTVPDRAARRAAVHTVLADYAPTEFDERAPDYGDRFNELQRHAFPSGATESDDDSVRRWLVNQTRFLFVLGGPGVHRAAVGPAQKLLDDWTSRFGPVDPPRLRLAVQLANLYRALGDPGHAQRLDEAVLALQRRSLARNHPQNLVAARGLGGDLRGLGLFTEALEEDQTTWAGFREELGDDHPQTQMAAKNIAVSLFLSGDTPGALNIAEDNYRQRRRLLGERNPRTWMSLAQVGVYQRESGNYPAALTALRAAALHLRQLQPDLDPLELTVRYQQAITLRCQGDLRSARQHMDRALRDYRELHGPDHPSTLACVLSLAAVRRELSEPDFAVELARTALDGFQARLADEHPFVALCRIGLGLALSRAGEASGPIHTSTGLESLRVRLGYAHPWTLAAAIDHAAVLVRRGDLERAGALIRTTHDDCVDFFGVAHPYTRVAAHNARLAGDSATDVWNEIDVDVPET
jgi:tetratricopeptide (TPR) repeat protein